MDSADCILPDFNCDFCAEVFQQESELQEHVETCHSDIKTSTKNGAKSPQSAPNFTCILDGKSFRNNADFLHHLTHDHVITDFLPTKLPLPDQILTKNGAKGPKNMTNVVCPLDGEVFQTEELLIAHLKFNHFIEKSLPNRQKMPQNVASGPKNVQNTANIACYLCCTSFKNDEALSNHLKISHFQETESDSNSSNSKSSLKCDQCGKIYALRSSLNRHIRRFHKGIHDYKCDICNMKFWERRDVIKHMQKTHQETNGEQLPTPNPDNIKAESIVVECDMPF